MQENALLHRARNWRDEMALLHYAAEPKMFHLRTLLVVIAHKRGTRHMSRGKAERKTTQTMRVIQINRTEPTNFSSFMTHTLSIEVTMQTASIAFQFRFIEQTRRFVLCSSHPTNENNLLEALANCSRFPSRSLAHGTRFPLRINLSAKSFPSKARLRIL